MCVCLRNLIRCLLVHSVNMPSVLLLLQPAAELPSPLVLGDGECSEFNKCPLAQLVLYPIQRQACRAEESTLYREQQYSGLLVVLTERLIQIW